MKTNIKISSFFAILAMCSSTATLSHHGVNGQFDVSRDLSVSGVVTDFRLANPHAYVYFNVDSEDGSIEEWRCEMAGGTFLRRNGWTEELLAKDTTITVKGNPSRRETFGCLAASIGFADGRVLSIDEVISAPATQEIIEFKARFADGTPNLNGNWIAVRQERNAGSQIPDRSDGERPARDRVQRPEGTDRPERNAQAGEQEDAPSRPIGGRRGGERGPQISQTEAGIAASAGYNRNDNPRFHCKTTNIFLDWTFNEMTNNIVQTGDSITLNYGFMEMISRTIHLNVDSHPTNFVPSRIGHSIGKWEGDTLIVNTIGFTEGYLHPNAGIKHSNQMHVVERFSLQEDGKTLNRSYTIKDPLYLATDIEGSDSVVRTAYPFQDYDCEDLTQERVEGF